MIEDALKQITDRVVKGGQRIDGWVNQLFGYGTERDPTQAGEFQDRFRIPDPELEALFHQSAIARKMVSLPPREMLRQGIQIQSGPAEKKLIQERLRYLRALQTYQEGMTWGRLFGGAVVFIGANDDRPASTPLDPSKVKSVDFLQVYDRRMISIVHRYSDPRNPKFRQPSVYRLQSIYGGASEVHETRCEVFRGALTDEMTRERLDTWDYSTLQVLYDGMRQFESVYKSGELMMRDASQGVFKMKGFLSAIAGGRLADIQTRAQLLDMTRSVARSIFLDADTNESFEKIATQFAGVDEMLDRFANKLAADSEIPVTLLMGKSPAGLNATGDNDIRIFYDTIRTQQENDLKPRLQHLLKLISRSLNLNPDTVDVKFPSLWQETPKEKAERKKMIADTDAIYITNEAVTPEEVAIARFTGEEFSDDLKIDPSLRKGSFLPPKALPGQGTAALPPAPTKAPPPVQQPAKPQQPPK